MLVLTRKENESIVIREDIEVRIARIQGNKVRVGVIAPKNVPVYRKELTPFFNDNFRNVEELNGSGAVLSRI
jgi:carbon storage regulator CsrA